MSSQSALMQISHSAIQNFLSYLKLSLMFIKRMNPVQSFCINFVDAIKSVLTVNKKLKIARYRVNHLRYRLYQMEKLIQENNSESYINGCKLNQLR